MANKLLFNPVTGKLDLVRNNLVDLDTKNHSDLDQLTWSTAGHTIDTDVSFGDNNITNVSDISLDTISSDAGTTVSVTLGTDAGDDFIVGNNNTLVVEGDNERVGIGLDDPIALLHVGKVQNAPTVFRTSNTNTGTSAYAGFSVTSQIGGSNVGFSVQTFNDNFNDFTGIGGQALGGWSRLRTDTAVNGFIMNVSGNAPLIFGTTNTERMRFAGDGTKTTASAVVNESTTNLQGDVTIGVTTGSQNTNLLFADPDVSHPFTALVPATTNARVVPAFGGSGGLAFQGFTDTDVTAFILQGHVGSTSPTEPAVKIMGFKSDGSTNRTAMTGNEIVCQIANSSDIMTFVGAGRVGINENTPDAMLEVVSNSTTEEVIKAKGAASQTGDLYRATNSSDTVLWKIGATGTALFQNDTDSTTAYQWLDADGGTPIMNIDTTNERVGIETAAPQACFDVGGHIASGDFSFGTGKALAAFSADLDNLAGIEMRNISNTSAAEFRFMLTDSNKNYLAYTMPSLSNGGSNLFGLARNSAAFIFSRGISDTRNLGIGTFAANDLVFGTNNTGRMEFDSGGAITINHDNNLGTTIVPLTIELSASHSADSFIIKDSLGNEGFQVEADFDVVIGSGAAGKDYTLTFNGETNDGVITWLEDERKFTFTGTTRTREDLAGSAGSGSSGDNNRVYTLAESNAVLIQEVYLDGVLLLETTQYTINNGSKTVTMVNQPVFDSQNLSIFFNI